MPNLPSVPAKANDAVSTTEEYAPPNATAGSGDARNWLRRVMRIAKPSASRKEVLTTDASLQSGPGPAMIVRTFDALNGGAAAPRGIASFPSDGNMAYIPHQKITTGPGKAIPLRTFDDAAHVPAVYAGNPNV